jgi:hypothetical protein
VKIRRSSLSASDSKIKIKSWPSVTFRQEKGTKNFMALLEFSILQEVEKE